MARKSFSKQLNQQLNPTEQPTLDDSGKQDESIVDEQKQPAEPRTAGQERDTVTVGRFMRKTYTLMPETVERIAEMADENGIGRSELARYLLAWAVDQVDTGKHTLPIQSRPTLNP